MAVEVEVLEILDSVLALRGRGSSFRRNTALLGSLPELDSMAVLGVMTALEDRFGFSIHDDEIDGSTFATVGALVDFVAGKVATQ